MYILIIDDDDVVRAGLGRLLVDAGHRVCWAADGRGGLRQMRLEHPDVVLLDIKLGEGMSGWDVAREKWLDSALRKIPLIIISGMAPSDVREGAQMVEDALVGTQLIMSKPVEFDELLLALKHLEDSKG